VSTIFFLFVDVD